MKTDDEDFLDEVLRIVERENCHAMLEYTFRGTAEFEERKQEAIANRKAHLKKLMQPKLEANLKKRVRQELVDQYCEEYRANIRKEAQKPLVFLPLILPPPSSTTKKQ